uniref:Uncharacterized protein n=1 Tax=viral metagenome TaxID=1070528 RepID=A0A6M3L391_9ZZZZ
MNLNDVRKWWDERLTGESNPYRPYFNWLLAEAEKLERVREWRKRLSNHEAVGTIEFDKALSDDKPKYTVLEQAVSACTCEYRPSRKCPIHGKVERSEHTVYKKGFCTCGLPLDDHGRCPEADLNLPESPQNIDEPDWGGLGKISNTHFLTAKLVEAVRWLKARIEALEK